MVQKPDWEVWENEVQDKLNLRSTVTSGNKWWDPSDGVTAGHPNEQDPYALMVDAKLTVQKSYSLNREFLDKWKEKATANGQAFALPVRFVEGNSRHSDWVTIPFEDYQALVEVFREANA